MLSKNTNVEIGSHLLSTGIRLCHQLIQSDISMIRITGAKYIWIQALCFLRYAWCPSFQNRTRSSQRKQPLMPSSDLKLWEETLLIKYFLTLVETNLGHKQKTGLGALQVLNMEIHGEIHNSLRWWVLITVESFLERHRLFSMQELWTVLGYVLRVIHSAKLSPKYTYI